MEALYVESSALLSVLLEGSHDFDAAFESSAKPIMSSLTLLEARRSLLRARLDGRIGPEGFSRSMRRVHALRARSHILPIDDQVLREAEREFPVEPIRSLDAVHLGTAMIWSSSVGPVTMASLDRRVRANAAALGLALIP